MNVNLKIYLLRAGTTLKKILKIILDGLTLLAVGTLTMIGSLALSLYAYGIEQEVIYGILLGVAGVIWVTAVFKDAKDSENPVKSNISSLRK